MAVQVFIAAARVLFVHVLVVFTERAFVTVATLMAHDELSSSAVVQTPPRAKKALLGGVLRLMFSEYQCLFPRC
jgi:hypothetical protein